MNITFGITQLGESAIIKLNCKLSTKQREEMIDGYGHIMTIEKIGKGLTRLEGAMDKDQLIHFRRDLDIARMESKAEELHAQIELAKERRRAYIPIEHMIDNGLDFI